MKHSTLPSSPNSGNTLVVGIPNRSLKFRCWDVFNQRMVNGPYLFEPYLDNHEPYRFYETWRDVEDGIGRLCYVMQFTGFKDVKGNEIYEGDIVYLAGIGYCAVVFSHAGWAFEDKQHLCFFNETEWSDVGNIMGSVFTHPELLG